MLNTFKKGVNMGILDRYLGFEDLQNVDDILKAEFIDAAYEEVDDGKGGKKAKIVLKHPGAFSAWCKKQGFDGVTCDCICKAIEVAKKNDDKTLMKQALFANNFAIKKKLGKNCPCIGENKND